MRPKIISKVPLKYKNLMEQCWNANPFDRPDIDTLFNKISEIKFYYQNNPNELPQLKAKIDKGINNANTNNKLFTSKIHKFENLPEPKNATEEEQEAFHSKLYDFNIPENIDDFGQSINQNSERITGSKSLSKEFKKLQINSKSVDIQNNNCRNTTHQPQTGNIDGR
ncbi:hypothetical protein RhiirA1_482586 [Rhizophagus irregularis]|uniref:Serine-threonine/tyrosine-protein kinase catalytic domain-containing protein n=1 Tax=Rhizophagus irregularis TaxID=588596 RepID=A0A2N0QLN4_9GLOM|nr:hypothetical protein RhiirA1_482586 [Rhizophagus irregularis]